jgi:hypothetical protein
MSASGKRKSGRCKSLMMQNIEPSLVKAGRIPPDTSAHHLATIIVSTLEIPHFPVILTSHWNCHSGQGFTEKGSKQFHVWRNSTMEPRQSVCCPLHLNIDRTHGDVRTFEHSGKVLSDRFPSGEMGASIKLWRTLAGIQFVLERRNEKALSPSRRW